MVNEQIIVMSGSFNPPTIAHLQLLVGAVDALNADKGIFVPSSQNYVNSEMKRAKHPEEALTESKRFAMLQAMTEEDPRLMVDDLEYHRKERVILTRLCWNYRKSILTQPFTFWLMAIRSIFFHGGTGLTNL